MYSSSSACTCTSIFTVALSSAFKSLCTTGKILLHSQKIVLAPAFPVSNKMVLTLVLITVLLQSHTTHKKSLTLVTLALEIPVSFRIFQCLIMQCLPPNFAFNYHLQVHAFRNMQSSQVHLKTEEYVKFDGPAKN